MRRTLVCLCEQVVSIARATLLRQFPGKVDGRRNRSGRPHPECLGQHGQCSIGAVGTNVSPCEDLKGDKQIISVGAGLDDTRRKADRIVPSLRLQGLTCQ